MSNFQFLQAGWPQLFKDAREAEKLALVSPKACAILCRSALENAVNWLYDNDSDLATPYDTRLSSLMHQQCFKDILQPSIFREINVVRLVGNNAAHGKRVNRNETLISVKNLYRFFTFLVTVYSESPVPQISPFNESSIPDGKEADKSRQELLKLAEKLDRQKEQARSEREQLAEQASQIKELKEKLAAQKQQVKERKDARKKTVATEQAIPLLISEQATRKLYIDLSLKESGWDNLREGRELEYEVRGMPKSTNPSGLGYADYVLWGDDGLPLAVIEAKKTMVDAHKGRHQAELYADCLEEMHGQRPLIFYTNGFDTYLWDDRFYTAREVHGYYSKDELQLNIDRRLTRQDLRNFMVNTEIAGRPYQLEAIQRVAENLVTTGPDGKLKGSARQSLLVMATGSGKTRVSAAIVDMLTKCDWAKRVLFLADRNALVTQAKNAFSEFLPHLSAIDLTKEKEDPGTRIVFSTYPTIMNRIDGVKNSDTRFYGAGHFDLIIIDEAHRSVYQKYGAIFAYFDSLLIGLTATPKKEIDRNTYGLFGIEDDDPTFAYELGSAVKDGFLVPPKAILVPIKFQREGIKYKDLSEAEKKEYEEKFGDPTKEEAPDEISSSALNSWLFNTDTVDKVLDHLMGNGIKVEAGDKLGKTIIFAKNHKHAVFIEERFNKNYPEYSGKFLRVIDNYETKAQDLLERFTDPYNEVDPQIAVSVDMMDTGVDAPRVVNLVFFKLVRATSKFWQMIGRGTRLCPDLFAPNEDKSHFLIFDFCQNFEFFDQNPDGIDGNAIKSLSQQIFEAKFEVAMLIRDKQAKREEEAELSQQYINELHGIVDGLDQDRFVVKKELRYVTEYKHRSRWENLSKGDVLDITAHLSHLVIPRKDDDELARRFDILVLNCQLALLADLQTDKYVNKISNIAKALVKKKNIPAVGQHIDLLKELQTALFWKGVNVNRLEEVRSALRELVKFLDKDQQVDVVTHFEDELDKKKIGTREVVPIYHTLKSYRDRVESYIRKNRNHLVIHKLNTNLPITQMEINTLEGILFDGDERGTKQDYLAEYGDQPLGKFIRSIVGLDIKSANEAFADFLQAGNLRADQMTFLNNIITYLTKNGTIDKAMLFEPPFTHINDQGLLGVFDDAQATKIIQIIDKVNRNAMVVGG
ncbi:MAG: DEAD/DEAH box helicase family protein [Thermodesulfobacteriota bacterium]